MCRHIYVYEYINADVGRIIGTIVGNRTYILSKSELPLAIDYNL